MKKSAYIYFFIGFLIVFSSCNSCRKEKPDTTDKKKVSEINEKSADTFNLPVARYEESLFELDAANPGPGLKKIKNKFLFFLDNDLNDPANIDQVKSFINDPVLKQAYTEIKKEFPDLSYFEGSLKTAILKYMNLIPGKSRPVVYTYMSGFLYEKPTIFIDSVLIIGLDTYLGQDYKAYKYLNIPAYNLRYMKKEYIVRDCMFSIGEGVVPKPEKSRTLLDLILYRGKLMYFTDLVVENCPDSLLLKYSAPQTEWCYKNEGNVWAFFIEKNLLFSTDQGVLRKFLAEGPFTATFSKSSPARIGEFIGWRIISAYMEKNPEKTFAELAKEGDSQKILNGSGYKPKKQA